MDSFWGGGVGILALERREELKPTAGGLLGAGVAFRVGMGEDLG